MTDYTNDIARYLNGQMTPAERHAFEKKVLEDPFLAEALEGAELLPASEFAQDVEALNAKIKQAQFDLEEESEPMRVEKTAEVKKDSRGARKWMIRVAAAVILLLTSVYVLQQIDFSPDQESQLALEETNQAEKIEATPDSTFDTKATAPKDQESPLPTIKNDQLAKANPTEAPSKVSSEDQLSSVEIAEEKNEQPVSVTPPETEKSEQRALAVEVEKTKEPAIQGAAAESADKKQATSRMAAVSSVAPKTIRGKVTDSESGAPIPGVNVIIKGTVSGSVTDANGEYQINHTVVSPTLAFSFIGFESKEAKVENGNELNVQLKPDVSSLSEVIVVGYGAEVSEPTTPTFELAYPQPGNRLFREYLEKNLVYPEEAKINKTEGRVTVDFYVEPDGSLSGFTVVRGIGSGCDEELIRLIQSGPKWIPSKKNGVPVRDKVRVRLKFELPK